jgi:hypothetical protein
MPLNVEKDLPSLPEDAESGSRMLLPPPFTGGLANATRSRLTLDLEKPLSPEELALLRHWNEATSAVCGVCTVRITVSSLSCFSGAFALNANRYNTVAVCVLPLRQLKKRRIFQGALHVKSTTRLRLRLRDCGGSLRGSYILENIPVIN